MRIALPANGSVAQAQPQQSSMAMALGSEALNSVNGVGIAAPVLAQTSSAPEDLPPEVTIPAALDWLTFDAQTGLLSGTPPQGYLQGLTITFLAKESEGATYEAGAFYSVFMA